MEAWNTCSSRSAQHQRQSLDFIKALPTSC
jgi:hypothetical protein